MKYSKPVSPAEAELRFILLNEPERSRGDIQLVCDGARAPFAWASVAESLRPGWTGTTVTGRCNGERTAANGRRAVTGSLSAALDYPLAGKWRESCLDDYPIEDYIKH